MTQKRIWLVAGVMTLALVTAGMLRTPITNAQSGTPSADRWLHVSVIAKDSDGETVRVNVPLSLVEKVLPAINKNKLQGGKIRVQELRVDEVDLRAVFEAVRDTKDGEFVTVESRKQNVRVAKEAGYLLVKVRETKGAKYSEKSDEKPGTAMTEERVDVRVPMSVVEALLSGAKDELDLVAAVRALSKHGDSVLVTVEDRRNTVKVWVDSKNAGM